MHAAPLRGTTRFELHNALWMNAAHAVLYTFFASALAFALALLAPRPWWMFVWVVVLLAASVWGAINRWRRTFDRSVQLVIDDTGILATRSRFGQIRWGDIASAQFRYSGSSGSMVVTFKDAQPWLRQANWLARTVFSCRSSKPLSVGFSLTEMRYDHAALHHFVANKTGAWRLGSPQ